MGNASDEGIKLGLIEFDKILGFNVLDGELEGIGDETVGADEFIGVGPNVAVGLNVGTSMFVGVSVDVGLSEVDGFDVNVGGPVIVGTSVIEGCSVSARVGCSVVVGFEVGRLGVDVGPIEGWFSTGDGASVISITPFGFAVLDGIPVYVGVSDG